MGGIASNLYLCSETGLSKMMVSGIQTLWNGYNLEVKYIYIVYQKTLDKIKFYL